MVAIASHPNQASANVVRLPLPTRPAAKFSAPLIKPSLDALKMSDLLDKAAIEAVRAKIFSGLVTVPLFAPPLGDIHALFSCG